MPVLAAARPAFAGLRTFRAPLAARSVWGDGSKPTPVELVYDVIEPSSTTTTDQSLVICHGLFGSKQNWRSLAKRFSQTLGMRVFTLDLRNHGLSPHALPHSYSAMAEDISAFFKKAGIDNDKSVNLLGHSMGGKAVMALALNSDLNAPLRTLISVDMSPAIGEISPEFAAYTDGMMDIERRKAKSRADADKMLAEVEKSQATRQFLLTNTMKEHDPDTGKEIIKFRLPLQLLRDEIPQIGGFPYLPPPPVSPPERPDWTGPVLFLKGSNSAYINRHNIPVAEAFFPNMRLEKLEAGHWVHAEQPAQTVDLVTEFIKGAK